jgi:hypothetical protein
MIKHPSIKADSSCKDTKKKGNNEERRKKVWKSERKKYKN